LRLWAAFMATAIRRHAAGRGPAPLLVVLDCKGGSDARKIADRARRVLRAAGAATTAITLAAARDDQFLVEQDLHEVAAPTSGLLRNRDHQVQQLPVAIAHRVTIFVPEPILMTAYRELTGRTPVFSRDR